MRFRFGCFYFPNLICSMHSLDRLLRALAICSFLLSVTPHCSWAQAETWRLSPFPDSLVEIRDFVEPYLLPWAGGLDNGQVSAFDLNLDGVDDLVVYDRHSERLLPFLHNGLPGTDDYVYAAAYDSIFPPVQGFALFRDYDGDGDRDLFTYQSAPNSIGHIVAYENLANLLQTQHFFRPYRDLRPLQTDRGGLGTEPTIEIVPYDLPALDDLDGDGDLDILTFDLSATLVEYHRNLSVELYAHADSLTFLLEEGCWGHFSESTTGSTMFLDVFCKQGERGTPSGQRAHLGSTLTVLDLNGDQAKDIMVGDVGADDMVTLLNAGDNDHAYMDSQTVNFPFSRPVDLATLPAAYHLDIDQDGVRDLVISPNEIGTSRNTRNFWYYRNTGNDSVPNFVFLTDDFLQEEMLDFGSRAYPLLVDYDQDGRVDLLVGHYGYFANGSQTTQLTLFRNFGSDSLPVWELITDNLGNLRNSGRYPAHVAPAMGDLDGDGDLDLLLGTIDGKLDYYRNISGSPSSIFPNFTLDTETYAGIDVGSSAAPVMVDVDGDSLIDLLIGEQAGNVNYYRNTGTPQAAAFTLATEQLGQADVAQGTGFNGYSKPQLVTVEGHRYLLVGNQAGYLQRFHWADSLAANDAFAVDTLMSTRQGGRYLAPAVADFNADSLPELMVGNASGGLTLWALATKVPVDTTPVDTTPVDTTPNDTGTVLLPTASSPAISVYPQPTQGSLIIELGADPLAPVQVKLYDLRGRILSEYVLTQQQTRLTLPKVPQGLYLLVVAWPDGRRHRQPLRIDRG
jgi:hypothetical protein